MTAGHTISATKLPVSAFANLPYIQTVSISPGGTHIGSWLNIDNGSLIIVKSVNTGESVPVISTDNTEFKINWFRWANDERLIISLRFAANRYNRPTTETRLVSINRDGTDAFNLVEHIRPLMNLQDNVVDWLPKDPDHILVAVVGERDRPIGPAVYRVNVYDGQKARVQRPYARITHWLTDPFHRVRVGMRIGAESTAVYIRQGRKGWRSKWLFDNFSLGEIWPLGFGLDPNTLFVQSYHRGRKAIFKVDITTSFHERELVLADPTYDIEGELVYSPRGEVVGIKHLHNGAHHFWDEKYLGLYNGIKKQFPDTNNQLLSFSNDEKRYILLTTSDEEPGTYYFGDRKHKVITRIGPRYPNIDASVLTATQKINYPARDGTLIEGYLTLPPAAYPDRPPVIIFPHGGPMERDSKEFDYWTAFFANRGYAVLQMNFRGSTGYGIEFMRAGFKNWGRLMQDDITDGVNWLIKKGIGDPERMCIVGASYGGYAAMMGLVKTPELYKCAVSFAGISDLPKFVFAQRNKIKLNQIGDSWKQLSETSPLHQVDRITAPLLIFHGEKDRVVPASQTRAMIKALKSAKKEYTYIELPNGDHYLSNQENRLLLFREMEIFLAQHLGSNEKKYAENTLAQP
ncbi:alpha/beta hydrolase family protein [Exilibacterium tricleocarpae]|uniref:alpha/beta hydrolase family protein n=1 Tax=Exilibacterium tricleocarpae TaxID=2591008 RepID=UPI0015D1E48E|nr:S9 family peptidase [Exilibacterium tricleocarpae]